MLSILIWLPLGAALLGTFVPGNKPLAGPAALLGSLGRWGWSSP